MIYMSIRIQRGSAIHIPAGKQFTIKHEYSNIRSAVSKVSVKYFILVTTEYLCFSFFMRIPTSAINSFWSTMKTNDQWRLKKISSNNNLKLLDQFSTSLTNCLELEIISYILTINHLSLNLNYQAKKLPFVPLKTSYGLLLPAVTSILSKRVCRCGAKPYLTRNAVQYS